MKTNSGWTLGGHHGSGTSFCNTNMQMSFQHDFIAILPYYEHNSASIFAPVLFAFLEILAGCAPGLLSCPMLRS